MEITDINNLYLAASELLFEKLWRRAALLDTGTHESLMQASNFIQTIEQRQGPKICCPEGVAYRLHWIDAEQLSEIERGLRKSVYGEYILSRLKWDAQP